MTAINRKNKQCPNCGKVVIGREDLNYHWLDIHSQEKIQSLLPTKHTEKITSAKTSKVVKTELTPRPAKKRAALYSYPAQDTPVKLDSEYFVERSVKESSLDGSRGYYDNFYEGNRLGSHPSHDDYGDESFS